MRFRMLLAVAAGVMALASVTPVCAGGRNPDGYGIYSPAEPPVRGRDRIYRYDPRSWYYRQRGYYPNYASAYWVQREEMRYRYRSRYVGPRYNYYPAWGYPLDW